jgi:ACT domain
VAGKAVVFVGGISGAKAIKAAEGAGFKKPTDLAALRVEGANRPGDAFEVANLLSKAGINLRGASASVIGPRYVQILAFDSAADADKAAGLLRGAGKESTAAKPEAKKK